MTFDPGENALRNVAEAPGSDEEGRGAPAAALGGEIAPLSATSKGADDTVLFECVFIGERAVPVWRPVDPSPYSVQAAAAVAAEMRRVRVGRSGEEEACGAPGHEWPRGTWAERAIADIDAAMAGTRGRGLRAWIQRLLPWWW